MSLNIVPSTSESRKQLFIETLMSKTNKVNKISDDSVIGATAYGIAKISGKAEKDIMLALSKLYPDTSFGTQLDQVLQDMGLAPRFLASQSSTFMRVVADPGTSYLAGVHTFQSTGGLQFDIEQDTVVGSAGFTYVKVRSTDTGIKTNVKPGAITTITPLPASHRFCVNEYTATGGRDAEDDISVRQRIKDGPNILARGTLAMIEQAFMLVNNNILEVRYQGINGNGQVKLAIVTQNGIALNRSEIGTLLSTAEEFLGLTELRPFGRRSYGVQLVNIGYQPIDMSFRCVPAPGANIDDIRVSIQTRVSKYLDFRYFVPGVTSVDWVNLLEITRNTPGMNQVPDNFFYPNVDIPTDSNLIPRMRGFLMLDMTGAVIDNLQGSFSPVFYPGAADFSFQASILRTITQ